MSKGIVSGIVSKLIVSETLFLGHLRSGEPMILLSYKFHISTAVNKPDSYRELIFSLTVSQFLSVLKITRFPSPIENQQWLIISSKCLLK